MKMSEELITPETAKSYLSLNRNRPLRRGHVERLARDMREGYWRPGGVIRFADTPAGPVLIDGQHRLAAVVQVGVPVSMLVIRGHALEDQNVIDTGVARTLGDALALRGETNAMPLAAAIGWRWRYEQKLIQRSHAAPTTTEGLQLLKDHPGLRHGCLPTRSAARRLRMSHGLASWLYYEMTVRDPDSCAEFWSKLQSGIDLGERDPIRLLRARLESNAASLTARLDRDMIAALIIKAWNAYIAGTEIGVLRWSRGGAAREAFPEIDWPQD